MLLRDGQTDGLGEALAQRAGGDFDARRLTHLGVPSGVRTPLAELLQLLHRQVVTGQVQHTVQQRRRVAVREHKTVAIAPLRVGGVVLHELVKEQIRDRRAAQRGSGVAVLGALHLVDGEEPEGIDRKLVECVLLLVAHCCPLVRVCARTVSVPEGVATNALPVYSRYRSLPVDGQPTSGNPLVRRTQVLALLTPKGPHLLRDVSLPGLLALVLRCFIRLHRATVNRIRAGLRPGWRRRRRRCLKAGVGVGAGVGRRLLSCC